ncbi:hypothetical protein [Sphingomonas jinjuensis]|uniref:hypothetical protein n=1 Tax=Sphingomonas jinjuensis TaxID=535907 RepID=UPI001C8642A0|nr:hypothetical protein [Sphingomonas jinjuensis]
MELVSMSVTPWAAMRIGHGFGDEKPRTNVLSWDGGRVLATQAKRGSRVDELPVRHLSRLGGEMHMSAIAALKILSPGIEDKAIVALVALRVCLPDWTQGDRPAPPVDIRHTTTLRSMARSLKWPLGSMHAMVARLIEDGLIARERRGLFIAPAAADRVIPYLEAVHDLTLRLAEDYHAAGGLRPSRRPGPCSLATLLAVALDIMLVPFETFGASLGDWTATKLWNSIAILSVRRIVLDPELSRRYAVGPPPDSERRAVPATRLREIAEVKLATAWRRLRALEEAGRISQRDGGWLIRTDQFLEKDLNATFRAGVVYYLRRLNELVAAGLNPANPPYFNGRPPWMGEEPLK